MIARTAATRSLWRFFPVGVILWLLFVVAVNAGMAWSALHSFPGIVEDHAFDRSNDYNAVLDTAAKQAALGWQLQVSVEQGRVVVTLDDRRGASVAGLMLTAVATHPLGPAETTRLDFAFDGRHHVATAPLPSTGPWDVAITGLGQEIQYRAARRVIVP
jgi:nitrogen fixation protein FixH